MKKITTFLLAVVFMAMSASATVTVNVRTSTGDAPYLYAWDGAGNKLNGEWPGTVMDESQTYTTTVDGLVWFTQTFEQDAINIVFNDGEDPAIQSSNIMGVTGTAFFTFDIEEGEYEDVTSTYISDTGFDVSTLPSTVAYVEGKEFAYFIAPVTWTNCNVWAWNSITGTNFTTSGAWPGDPITLIGNTTDGYPVYQWIGADIVEGCSGAHLLSCRFREDLIGLGTSTKFDDTGFEQSGHKIAGGFLAPAVGRGIEMRQHFAARGNILLCDELLDLDESEVSGVDRAVFLENVK